MTLAPVHRASYRLAAAVALAAALLLIWLSLGVGIIGKDGDRANALYAGVLAVGAVGALLARFKPHGMARTLSAMALVQAAIAALVLFTGMGRPYDTPAKILLLNGFFVTLFGMSAWLFRRAGRG